MNTPLGLRSSCARVAHLALGLLASCGRVAPATDGAVALRETTPITLDTTAHLVRWDPDLAPLTIRTRTDGFAVLDRGRQQLVLLDSALQPERRIGRRGSGPGELNGITRLEAWPRGLAIGEGGNGRISLYAMNGAFTGVVRRRYLGTPFTLSRSGALTTPVQVPPHLVDVGSLDDATPRRVGVRPPVAHPDDERHMGRDLLFRLPNGRALLIENRTGVLFELDDDGTVTASWTLPMALGDALRQQRRSRVAAFEARSGNRVFAAPLMKDASAASEYVLIAHSVAPRCLLLLDLRSIEARPIAVPDSALNAALCRAESIAITTDYLAVAADDSLLLFRSPIPRTLH
jgi:hypothetical protein